jgi:hypothetical protein
LAGRVERVQTLTGELRGPDPTRRVGGADELAGVTREVLAAGTPELGYALLDEHLADVARELDVGAAVPRAAARIALASGTGLAIVDIATELPKVALGSPAVAFLAGIGGATLAGALGRLADARSEALRIAYDDLSRRLQRIVSANQT